ncbi:MAG: helix-turn-helix domain-containing protein [Nitrosomonas sp.]|nr:helix-turn-helix domain-containing protein [Nitrosomonas sp.]
MKNNELDESGGLVTDQQPDCIPDTVPTESTEGEALNQVAPFQAKPVDMAQDQPVLADDSAGMEKENSSTATGFGQILRETRIQRGMSVSEVARRLRLSEQQVEAIEAQDFSRLPAAVFLRGYIRNYANVLQLDDIPLLVEAMPQAKPVDKAFSGKKSAQRFKAIEPVYRSGRGGRGGWLYVAVILAALAAYGIYREEIPEQLASFSPDGADQVVNLGSGDMHDQVAVDLALPLSSTAIELPLVAPAGTGSNLPPIATTLPELPAQQSSLAAEASKTTKNGTKSLHFSFSRDSWVKIKDSSGRVILEKTHLRGTEQAIEGKPPLYLVIGNAAGVSLTYNGNKVDLAPYTRGNDDVARFSLE